MTESIKAAIEFAAKRFINIDRQSQDFVGAQTVRTLMIDHAQKVADEQTADLRKRLEAAIKLLQPYAKCGVIFSGYSPDWTCLDQYNYVIANDGKGYGDPLLSQIRSKQNLCSGCRIIDALKELQEATKDE